MKSTLFAALVFLAASAPFSRSAVTVTVFRIEENRSLDFGNDQVSRTPPAMTILLSLSGPEAESSLRYGNLKLDEAVDDQGDSLIPAKDAFNDDTKFKDYANSFFRKNKFGSDKPADPQVDLTLAVPKRTATKISRLRGSLTLSSQGTLQSVELTKLKSGGTQTFAFPPEAHLGVTTSVAGGNDVQSIGLEITGDEGLLESIEMVDASGQTISTGMSSWSMNGGPAHKSLDLSRPLDDSMKLVAKFSLDRKLTVVPFDFKDINLP
jgi:hypothetical protein